MNIFFPFYTVTVKIFPGHLKKSLFLVDLLVLLSCCPVRPVIQINFCRERRKFTGYTRPGRTIDYASRTTGEKEFI